MVLASLKPFSICVYEPTSSCKADSSLPQRCTIYNSLYGILWPYTSSCAPSVAQSFTVTVPLIDPNVALEQWVQSGSLDTVTYARIADIHVPRSRQSHFGAGTHIFSISCLL